MTGAKKALEEEHITYSDRVADWVVDHDGEFVVIKGSDVLGFYPTYERALTEGYERYGVAPFLVKEVSSQEQAHFVSRFVAPTPV